MASGVRSDRWVSMRMKEEDRKRTYGSFKLTRVATALIVRRCRVGVFGVLGVGVGLSTIIRGQGIVDRRCVGDLLWEVIRGRGGLDSGS